MIADDEMDFNLVELRNGITAELPVVEIPAVAYDLKRLYVQSASVVLKDKLGEFDLTVPSGAKRKKLLHYILIF